MAKWGKLSCALISIAFTAIFMLINTLLVVYAGQLIFEVLYPLLSGTRFSPLQSFITLPLGIFGVLIVGVCTYLGPFSIWYIFYKKLRTQRDVRALSQERYILIFFSAAYFFGWMLVMVTGAAYWT